MTTAGRGEKSFPPLQLFFTETDHQCKMRRKTTTWGKHKNEFLYGPYWLQFLHVSPVNWQGSFEVLTCNPSHLTSYHKAPSTLATRPVDRCPFHIPDTGSLGTPYKYPSRPVVALAPASPRTVWTKTQVQTSRHFTTKQWSSPIRRSGIQPAPCPENTWRVELQITRHFQIFCCCCQAGHNHT